MPELQMSACGMEGKDNNSLQNRDLDKVPFFTFKEEIKNGNHAEVALNSTSK